MKQKTQWVKPRHRIAVALVHLFFGFYVRMRYHITIEPFREQGKRPYLIVMNHQTGFDQFFVGMTFRQPVYYIATEDIFSLGWVSDIIRWLVEPIPIRKQTTDIKAVKDCIKVAREGGTICLAPEGNRTFHGRTVYMNPSIASLAKKLALPIAFFRIEGGYGIQPRWSDVVRGGTMRSYVSRVMEPEEFADMTKEQLAEIIRQELFVDEGKRTGEYPHPKNAEFLERAMYVCPKCGLTTFERGPSGRNGPFGGSRGWCPARFSSRRRGRSRWQGSRAGLSAGRWSAEKDTRGRRRVVGAWRSPRNSCMRSRRWREQKTALLTESGLQIWIR